MLGGFYGLTGVNLILSPISFVTFKELIKGLDTKANRFQLAVLKSELNDVLKFLGSFPVVYSDPKLTKLSAELRRLKKSEDKDYARINEIEDILNANSDKQALSLIGMKGVHRTELSEQARTVIEFLLKKKSLIEKYESLIPNTENEESGVSVFGRPLYLLRPKSRVYLDYFYYNTYTESLTNLDSLSRDVNLLTSLTISTKDKLRQAGNSKVSRLHDEAKRLVLSMDLDYFDRLFGFENTSLKFYYDLSEELMEIGLYLFNVFPEDLFNEFDSTVSMDTDTDLRISEDAYPGMYKFVSDIKEAYDSYLAVQGGDLVE